MKFGFIYKTTNKINGKSYIGMCSSPRRFKNYLGSGVLLKQAIDKYGSENFEREILEWCENDNELRESEDKWIKEYDAVNSDIFYNLCEGGRGGNTGFNMSGEELSTRIKKTWDSYTPEEKKSRIGNFGRYDKSGKNNPMYGRSAVTEKNLKWYTNGLDNLYITEGTQPSDYRRGRTLKKGGSRRL